MKKCKQGYYYCYKDKKCKRIPGGYRVGLGGYLRREREEERSEDSGETETKKNGNGNGNGNGGNGNGGNGGGNGGGGVSEAVMTKAQIKKRDKIADSMSTREFNKRYGKDRGKSVKYATATKLAMEEGWSDKYKKSIDCDNPKGFSQKAHCQGKKKMNEETCPICGFDPCQCLEGVITEKRDGKSSKDKGYSLRDWFKGGGWKQTGGKYDGKPCAKQPGQKTKPYCRDADDRAAMSKEERNKRAAKKRKEDPNPNRKGKAKNVTQESYSNWRQDLQEKPGDGYLGPTMKVGKKEYGVPNPIRIAKDVHDNTNRAQKRRNDAYNQVQPGSATFVTPYSTFNNQTSTASQTLFGMQKQSYEPEGEVVEGYNDGDVIRPTDRIRMKDGKLRTLKDLDAKLKDKGTKKEEVELVDEGKKDACYHKVKSRYSVWPSAYASGALVKCRKVGAKNWGNKSKKNESVDYSNWRDDFIPTEYETTDLIKADPIQVPPSNLQKIEEAKKCWKGYKKTGTQKLFGKTYNRCEKIKKEHFDWRAEINIQEAMPGYEKYNAAVKAANKLTGRDKINALKAAAALRPPTEKEVNQKIGESVKPDKKPPSKKLGPTRRPFPQPGDKRPERPPGPGHEEPLPPWDDPLAKLNSNRKSFKEDWQKSNRNDGVDGMSQKSVDAYKRENPGSKLKTAVTGKVKKGSKDAKRRKSFCSRSDGQRKMHNIDCKKTPDKKICKARRRWKC